MIVPAEGGDVREIARFGEDEGILHRMTWTPNGDALWYLRKTDGEDPQQQVWHIPVDGEGDPKPLALKGKGLRALQFRHDGQQIAYIAGEGKHELWVMEDFLSTEKGAK